MPPIRFRHGLVLRAAMVAALGGLIFGFDTAVISGATDALKVVFRQDQVWFADKIKLLCDFLHLGESLDPLEICLGFTVATAMIGKTVNVSKESRASIISMVITMKISVKKSRGMASMSHTIKSRSKLTSLITRTMMRPTL